MVETEKSGVSEKQLLYLASLNRKLLLVGDNFLQGQPINLLELTKTQASNLIDGALFRLDQHQKKENGLVK